MSELDEIQERYDIANRAQDAYVEGKGSATLALLRSTWSTMDVPKLVAAIRAVEAVADKLLAESMQGSTIIHDAGIMQDAERKIRKAIRKALK